MSTEFNPATLADRGEVFKAVAAADPNSCDGCAFPGEDLETCLGCHNCAWYERPDGKNIIWVKPKEEPK